MGFRKDLTGQRFAMLTVTEHAGQNERGQSMWLCLCDCGIETTTQGHRLTSGMTKSCGCLRRVSRRRPIIDMAGQRIGRLLVISGHIASNRVTRSAMWLCRCDCGQEKVIDGSHLRSKTTSCGCRWREIMTANRKPIVGYFSAHRRVDRIKGRAATHICVDCQGTAAEWSYDGQDPEAVQDDRGIWYSHDPSHYDPRCVPCHRRHDRAAA